MYDRNLVPMALDHGVSRKTLEVARTLRGQPGEIFALHVYEMPQGSVSAFLDEDAVRAGFDRAKAQLADKLTGMPDITPVLEKGHSARTIIDYVDAHNIDCIVIGSHKPGLSDYSLGSTAARIVRHASCAVHVLRDNN